MLSALLGNALPNEFRIPAVTLNFPPLSGYGYVAVTHVRIKLRPGPS